LIRLTKIEKDATTLFLESPRAYIRTLPKPFTRVATKKSGEELVQARILSTGFANLAQQCVPPFAS
jgi:hypothetical protein